LTQQAIIKKLIAPGKAEVEVLRGTSCGDACGSCQVCKYASKIRVEASNDIGAIIGDRVEIDSKSSEIYGAAFLVYVMPFILFFIGYAVSAWMGMAEGASVIASFACMAVGFLAVVIITRLRKKGEIAFTITRIIDHGDMI
jgi:sigma-E factor negative regulatory protein RseC